MRLRTFLTQFGFMSLVILAANNGWASHYQRAPQGGWYHGEGLPRPLSTVSWARNLSTLGHIDFETNHGRSTIPGQVRDCVNAVWLQPCAMTRPVELALETPDHSGITSGQRATSPGQQSQCQRGVQFSMITMPFRYKIIWTDDLVSVRLK